MKDPRTPDERNTHEYSISTVTIKYVSGTVHELALREAIDLVKHSYLPTMSYNSPVVRVRTVTIKQTQQTIE